MGKQKALLQYTNNVKQNCLDKNKTHFASQPICRNEQQASETIQTIRIRKKRKTFVRHIN